MTDQKKPPELDDASAEGSIEKTSPADSITSQEHPPREWLQQMPLGAYDDDAERDYGEHDLCEEPQLAEQKVEPCAGEVKYDFDPTPVRRLGMYDKQMKRQAGPPFDKQEFIEPLPEAEPQSRSYDELLIAAHTLASDAGPATIERLALEASGLSKVEADRILRVIKQRTGTPMGALRALVSESGREKLDDLTLSRLVLAGVGRELIFATDAAVYIWEDRGVWWVMQDIALKQLVQHGLEAITAVNANTVNNVTSVLKNEIYVPRIELNRGDPSTVNTRNGELILNPGAGCWELQTHNRDAYRTTQIPVKYDPKARAPRFAQYMSEIFRDDDDREEKIQCLLQLIGYTLASHCRYEKFVILIGSGANGKSVLLAVLEALLGIENVASVQPSLFDNPFYRAHLYMRLANFVTELKEGEVIADAALKSIVSGESTTASRKFQPPFDFRPYATCWFGSNHMPHTRDFSDALFRRAVILTFNRKFDAAKGEADPLLKEKLMGELPGILNLALDAYAQWQLTGKFTEPKSSQTAKGEWRLEADQVQQFVEDRCTRDPKERVQSQQLYTDYRRWADECGITQRLTQKSFVSRLERLGFGRARTNAGKYITGIIINSG